MLSSTFTIHEIGPQQPENKWLAAEMIFEREREIWFPGSWSELSGWLTFGTRDVALLMTSKNLLGWRIASLTAKGLNWIYRDLRDREKQRERKSNLNYLHRVKSIYGSGNISVMVPIIPINEKSWRMLLYKVQLLLCLQYTLIVRVWEIIKILYRGKAWFSWSTRDPVA